MTDPRRQSQWCESPPPLHTPTLGIPTGQRSDCPASTVAWTRTSHRIPCGQRRRPSAVRVCAGHSPGAEAEMTDASTPLWIPPPGTREGPSPAFPQVRGPFSTWWQVKDSNLRSFRDGFTDQRRQACDQRECPVPPTTCVRIPHRQPTTADYNRTPQRAIRDHGVAP